MRRLRCECRSTALALPGSAMKAIVRSMVVSTGWLTRACLAQVSSHRAGLTNDGQTVNVTSDDFQGSHAAANILVNSVARCRWADGIPERVHGVAVRGRQAARLGVGTIGSTRALQVMFVCLTDSER